jgi:hypothetical protein
VVETPSRMSGFSSRGTRPGYDADMPTLLLLADLALANGQTSHQHITTDAIPHVPPGPLADFMAREDVRDALLNGAMFPDGGYAVGDDYGEMAHWEPLQDLYLQWIVQNHPAPFDDEGAQHVAFYLGMLSHGMADQFYDATFMERSRASDPAESWSCCSMDEATDVAYAAERGEGVVPPKWWPRELLDLFAARGHTVSEDTVDQGQELLGLAINYVGVSSRYEETVARYTEQFPWACTHQVDPAVVGNPPHEERIVAAYWQVAWERLNGGDGWSRPIIATQPEDGGHQPVRDHTSVDARLAVVFAKGLDPSSVEETGLVRVARASDGTEVPVEADVFYGQASHVVNLLPRADWEADTDYVVTVSPGARTFDGMETAGALTWTFTTRAPDTDGSADSASDVAVAGCGCATRGPADGAPARTGAAALAGAATLLLAARRRHR